MRIPEALTHLQDEIDLRPIPTHILVTREAPEGAISPRRFQPHLGLGFNPSSPTRYPPGSGWSGSLVLYVFYISLPLIPLRKEYIDSKRCTPPVESTHEE